MPTSCGRAAPYRTRMTETPSVALSPIADEQVDQVAEFLHRELNPRVTTEAWAEGIKVQWAADAPNRASCLSRMVMSWA